MRAYVKPVGIVLVGILSGALFGWFLRPVIIGMTLGPAIGVRSGGFTRPNIGAAYGAWIGLIVAALTGPGAVFTGPISILDVVISGIIGAVWGALVGGVTSKFTRLDRSRLW